MLTIPIQTPIKPRRRTVDDIPVRPLAQRAVKLYLVGNLAWDYTDTVLNIASSLRRDSTRALSRSVRQLRLDYDRTRQYLIDPAHEAKETELALLFEVASVPVLDELNRSLVAELAPLRLDTDNAMLVRSVQMALTLIDVMKRYASVCDAWIKSFGVHGHSILDDRFRRLALLLPHFAGDCYNPASPARSKAADLLYTSLLDIEIQHDPL